jgi:hypothetical protein
MLERELWCYGLNNGMSLGDFIGKQIGVAACAIREGGGRSIHLKCPKRVINELQIPERRSYNSSYKRRQ